MKIVYIAGPYGDANGHLVIDQNIARARWFAAWLANNGIGFICPHLNSAHFEVITPKVKTEFWYEMDLRLMDAADALFVLEGSENSKGVARETIEWRKTGKPLFYSWERSELLEWATP